MYLFYDYETRMFESMSTKYKRNKWLNGWYNLFGSAEAKGNKSIIVKKRRITRIHIT
jgi:hypothetical protein